MMIWDGFPVPRFLCGRKSGMSGLIYNKVSSPLHVRILENPHFFEKKLPESLPESNKWRTFALAFRKGRHLKRLCKSLVSKIFDMIWIQETQYEK